MTNIPLKTEIQRKVKEFEKVSNITLTDKEKTLLEMGIQIGIKLGIDLIKKEIK
jgi:hypothetical protein